MTDPAPAESFLRDLLSRSVFPDPRTVVACAVSGGADSSALLVLAVAAGCDVTAIHVDHGLRPGSADEADVVAATAQRFGARFRAETSHVALGPNLEARAREARYGVLPAGVLTGHTADDLAETVLLNLSRGAGLDGLAPMVGDPRRPIVGLRRAETERLCELLEITVVEDSSNRDPAFRRNRVRHELLPLINDIADRDVVPVVARQASLLADEAALLDDLADDLDATDARAVAAAPLPLARRALRALITRTWAADVDHPPDSAAIERALGVARNESVATDLGEGWEIRRSEQVLYIHKVQSG